jgi:hypothetical protein
MISHKYRAIFIHNRKCAGGTIKKLFVAKGGVERGSECFSALQDGLCDKYWCKSGELIGAYTKFCVVRNPWDKFVSAWHYLEDFRTKDIKSVLSNLPRPVGTGHDYRHITRQQSQLIFDEREELVVDRVVKFETLREELMLLLNELGMDVCEEDIGWEHRGQRRDVGDYRRYFYDDECHRLFEAAFPDDIRLLGYQF